MKCLVLCSLYGRRTYISDFFSSHGTRLLFRFLSGMSKSKKKEKKLFHALKSESCGQNFSPAKWTIEIPFTLDFSLLLYSFGFFSPCETNLNFSRSLTHFPVPNSSPLFLLLCGAENVHSDGFEARARSGAGSGAIFLGPRPSSDRSVLNSAASTSEVVLDRRYQRRNNNNNGDYEQQQPRRPPTDSKNGIHREEGWKWWR